MLIDVNAMFSSLIFKFVIPIIGLYILLWSVNKATTDCSED